MNLIYEHSSGGKIFQGTYRGIPHDLCAAKIDLVIYAAYECPPLSHHQGAVLKYYPNDDKQCETGSKKYEEILQAAKEAVPDVVSAVRTGKDVLVTCNQGINRSSLVTGLALKQLTNKSGWEVINLIKEKREGTLTNSSFMTMLINS